MIKTTRLERVPSGTRTLVRLMLLSVFLVDAPKACVPLEATLWNRVARQLADPKPSCGGQVLNACEGARGGRQEGQARVPRYCFPRRAAQKLEIFQRSHSSIALHFFGQEPPYTPSTPCLNLPGQQASNLCQDATKTSQDLPQAHAPVSAPLWLSRALPAPH